MAMRQTHLIFTNILLIRRTMNSCIISDEEFKCIQLNHWVVKITNE